MKGIVQHQKGNRKGIQDGAKNDTDIPVQEKFHMQQIGYDAVITEQQYQPHPMGDGGDKHRQCEQHGVNRAMPDMGTVHKPGKCKGQGYG